MSSRLGADLRDNLDDATKVLEELQLAQHAQEEKLRSGRQARTGVVVRPADSIERGTSAVTGTARELRGTMAIAVLARPIAVGSFFELTFDSGERDLPPTFGRCDRCTMLGELEFEARFQVLQPVVLPGAGPSAAT